MQGRVARVALTFTITAGALMFSGCGTIGGRISQHPEMYQSLTPNDQALVSQGQIRSGMSMDAVWLAWGTADQKLPASIHDRPAETWVYLR
jgi:outer membrane protein assembly factor BamE (lipoprotein component of BamABCDE complex)